MAFIKTEKNITSLENVKNVEFVIYGSGTKSNPYGYMIDVDYFQGNTVYLRFQGDNAKEKAEETFKTICAILLEKGDK